MDFIATFENGDNTALVATDIRDAWNKAWDLAADADVRVAEVTYLPKAGDGVHFGYGGDAYPGPWCPFHSVVTVCWSRRTGPR